MNRKNNTTIGLDIAKNVFHYAQLNRNGRLTGSGMLKRNKVLSHSDAIPKQQLYPTRLIRKAYSCISAESDDAGQQAVAAFVLPVPVVGQIDSNPEVVIIGAGAAGLASSFVAAARTLMSLGRTGRSC